DRRAHCGRAADIGAASASHAPRRSSGYDDRERADAGGGVRIDLRLPAPLSSSGLVVGTLLFAFSLTPSLLPRSAPMQGLVSGLSLAAGYGIGVLGDALWRYLELPRPQRRWRRAVRLAAGTACAITAAVFLWKASGWQNSVRMLMEMPPVEGARPLTVGLIAAAVFGAVVIAARLFKLLYRAVASVLARYVPQRVSHLIGIVIAAAAFWSIVDGVL